MGSTETGAVVNHNGNRATRISSAAIAPSSTNQQIRLYGAIARAVGCIQRS